MDRDESPNGASAAPADRRTRGGRPRNAALDARILAAALRLLTQVGFSEMTMDAVAAAAGVAKPAIYRRWSSKEELAIDALAAHKPLHAIAETGDTRADLREFVERMLRPRLATEARVARRLFDDAVSRPELRRLLWERHVRPRREELRAYLERAVARGDVRPDLDLDIAPDIISGAVVSVARTAVLSGARPADEHALAERVVTSLWQWLAAEVPGLRA